MNRLFRVGLMLAGMVAAGLVVYELVRESMEKDEGVPSSEGRPPFAEAAEYGMD